MESNSNRCQEAPSYVKTVDLCKEAQERLEALRLDDIDRVVSLALPALKEFGEFSRKAF